MKWVDIGTVETDFGQRWVVLHACPRCKAVVCGEDVPDHEKWHELLDSIIPVFGRGL